MQTPIKVAILEDQQIFRKGLVAFLNNRNDFTVTSEAENVLDLRRALAANLPDVLITDLHLADGLGAGNIELLAGEFPGLKLMVLSGERRSEHVLAAVRAGALGYVIKDANVQELIIALKALVGGNSYFSSEINGVLLGRIRNRRNGRNSTGVHQQLTKREREILEYTYREMSNQDIARHLFISPRTVDTHKRNLMKKLQVKNSVGLVKYYLRMK